MKTKLFSLLTLMLISIGVIAQQPYTTEISRAEGTIIGSTGKLVNDNTTLTLAGSPYRLLDRMYVEDGQTLTIEPGVVVRSVSKLDPVESVTLVVTQGGKIFANGTKDNPIIFTHDDDPLDGTFDLRNQRLWGGIILLGKAYNNIEEGDINPEDENGALVGAAAGVGYIEGLAWPDERHWYGKDAEFEIIPGDPDDDTIVNALGEFDDDDSSGALRYVSIRHGGTNIGEANEINGLTCGSVGRGTILENIEIVANGDDGVEFFGGTVNIRNLSVMFAKDDYVDWDQGWTGNVQFVLGVQLNGTGINGTADFGRGGDNGLEADGDDGIRGDAGAVVSAPTVYNVTMLGAGLADGDKALELKERTQGLIANSIFTGYATSVALEDTEGGEDNSRQFYLTDGTLEIKNVSFVNCGAFPTYAATELAADGNIELATASFIDAVHEVEVDDAASPAFEIVDAFNAVPNSSAADYATAGIADVYPLPSDPWFQPANYRGAFAPDAEPWTDAWTYHEDLGSDNAVVDCPTDINGSGTTDVADFNLLAGKFNQPCSNK